MARSQMNCWECDICGYKWPIRISKSMAEILPTQCQNKQCRSRQWNSGKREIAALASGVLGERPNIATSKQWKQFRQVAKISQKTLAEKLGISMRTVAYIEAGEVQPSLNTQLLFNATVQRFYTERKQNAGSTGFQLGTP